MIKKGREIFDSDLYNDILAIRSQIKTLQINIKKNERHMALSKSNLFRYGKAVIALEHILSLDKYKEMNESIEEDEKHEERFGY